MQQIRNDTPGPGQSQAVAFTREYPRSGGSRDTAWRMMTRQISMLVERQGRHHEPTSRRDQPSLALLKSYAPKKHERHG